MPCPAGHIWDPWQKWPRHPHVLLGQWANLGKAQRDVPIPALCCHLAVPPLCKDQISLSPGKPHDRTSKILRTPMKACEQLQFNSDMYSFVRRTSKPLCAFWPIYSRPVCVKSSLNLFPGQKSLSWTVFVLRRMVETV